ncbi:hypothetical protein BDZ45DRAFT_313587 [Acephala macrosclerotiorum]|nr:hypothetical protein BDZ45DRAFT_313587 [Acephala macrosclerotiorum]
MRMLHISDHFEEDSGIDFDEAQPDTLLISHFVGLGHANLLYSQKSSGRNILHHPLRNAVLPKHDENFLGQYHDSATQNRARSGRTPKLGEISDTPNSDLRMSHWNDLIPINRRALFRESRRKREKEEEKWVYDQDKEDRRRRRESKKGIGGSSKSSREEKGIGHHQASVSKGAQPLIQNASHTPKLMENGKGMNSQSEPRFEPSSLSLPADANAPQGIKISGGECLVNALPDHNSVAPNTTLTSSKLGSLNESILTSIMEKDCLKGTIAGRGLCRSTILYQRVE